MPEISRLSLLLVIAPTRCSKCEECQRLVARLQEMFPGRLDCRQCTTDDEEAAQFGVIMPPLLLVGDFIAALGKAPQWEALVRLIEGKLASRPASQS